ncbi:hypothetical protein HDV00_009554 [Rhizophlyctis rosea]|nr:hypothetical protein HDV00_009554 [Rhizophlyctis rosea]
MTYIIYPLVLCVGTRRFPTLLLVDRLFRDNAKHMRPDMARAHAAKYTTIIDTLTSTGHDETYQFPKTLFKNPFFNKHKHLLNLFKLTPVDLQSAFLLNILPLLRYESTPMSPTHIAGKHLVAFSCQFCVIEGVGGEEVVVLRKPQLACGTRAQHTQKVVAACKWTWAVKFAAFEPVYLLDSEGIYIV